MAEPCVKEEKIQRLETDVLSINDRLNRHSDKIDKISDNNLVLETILKRLEEDSKDQKQINSEMQKTMVSIQGAMTEITFNVKELNNKLTETDKKVESTSNKLSCAEEKNKIDTRDIIKSWVVPLLGGAGIIYGIIELAKNFVK